MSDHPCTSRALDPYRAAFAAHPAPTWLISAASGRILDANDAAARRLGYSREELRALAIEELAEWRDGSALRRAWSATGAAARSGVSARLRTRDGRWMDAMATLFAVSGAPDSIRVLQVTEAAPDGTRPRYDGERYRLASEASRDALYDWDADTETVWWSEQFLNFFGHPHSVAGSDLAAWERLIHPDDRQRVREGLHRSVAAREPGWQDEYRLRRGDGTFAHVFDRARLLYDDDGRLVRAVGLVADVTARREAEHELTRSREVIHSSLENLLDPLSFFEAVRDAQGRVVDLRATYMNAAARAQSHHFPEELRRPLGELHPSLHRTGLLKRLANVVQTGDPLNLRQEWVQVHAPGEEEPSLRSFDIGVTRAGDGLVVTWRDVTEQVQAEQALRESEERFRELAENIREVFWISDPTFSRIFYLSPSFEQIWGYPRDGLYDHPRGFLDHLHPGDRERVEAALATMPSGEFDEEYRIMRPDGEIRWTRARGFAIRGDDGEVQRIAGIAEDITVQKDDARRIQKALAEKEVLLREVHHRVKNNLQIVSSLMRLQARTSTAPEARTVFRQSQARIQSMALLHQLLYRSSDLGHIELGDYLRTLGRHLLQLFDGRGRLSFHVTGTQHVDLDSAVTYGLIANELISNSFRHAFPNGQAGTVAVELESCSAPSGLVMSVRDDGIGSAAPVDLDGGASLGLRLVEMLAEQLGGTVRHRREGGTVITVEVPFAAEPAVGPE